MVAPHGTARYNINQVEGTSPSSRLPPLTFDFLFIIIITEIPIFNSTINHPTIPPVLL